MVTSYTALRTKLKLTYAVTHCKQLPQGLFAPIPLLQVSDADVSDYAVEELATGTVWHLNAEKALTKPLPTTQFNFIHRITVDPTYELIKTTTHLNTYPESICDEDMGDELHTVGDTGLGSYIAIELKIDPMLDTERALSKVTHYKTYDGTYKVLFCTRKARTDVLQDLVDIATVLLSMASEAPDFFHDTWTASGMKAKYGTIEDIVKALNEGGSLERYIAGSKD